MCQVLSTDNTPTLTSFLPEGNAKQSLRNGISNTHLYSKSHTMPPTPCYHRKQLPDFAALTCLVSLDLSRNLLETLPMHLLNLPGPKKNNTHARTHARTHTHTHTRTHTRTAFFTRAIFCSVLSSPAPAPAPGVDAWMRECENLGMYADTIYPKSTADGRHGLVWPRHWCTTLVHGTIMVEICILPGLRTLKLSGNR